MSNTTSKRKPIFKECALKSFCIGRKILDAKIDTTSFQLQARIAKFCFFIA